MPSHPELAPMFVHHAQVHEQVRRQLLHLEVRPLHRQLRPVTHRLEQGVHQRAVCKARQLTELSRKLRQRNQARACLLVQRLAQHLHLLLEHAGHQPLTARLLHLVQGVQRDRDRQAIARIARLVQVGGSAVHPAQADHLGECLCRDARRLVPHQLLGGELEHIGVVSPGDAVPALQRRQAAHVLPKVLAVIGLDQGIVDQQVLATRLVLQRLHRADGLSVVWQEGKALVPLGWHVPLHQSLADEDLPGQRSVQLGEAHASIGIHQQAVQRGPL